MKKYLSLEVLRQLPKQLVIDEYFNGNIKPDDYIAWLEEFDPRGIELYKAYVARNVFKHMFPEEER